MNLEKCWFISDTHFGHDRVDETGQHQGIIAFERTKFKTIQDHDSYIQEHLITWAKTHANSDCVLYHLGDFGNWRENIWLISAIQDYGIEVNFMVGNHDRMRDVEKYASYFDNVYTIPQYICERVIISHEPQFPAPVGVINVHGHLHGAILDSDQHINASIGVIHYNPISGKMINKRLAAIPKANYKFLREPYADKYIFTTPKTEVVMLPGTNKIDLPASLARKYAVDNS